MFDVEVAIFEVVLMLFKKGIFVLCELGKYPTMWLGSHWGCIAKI